MGLNRAVTTGLPTVHSLISSSYISALCPFSLSPTFSLAVGLSFLYSCALGRLSASDDNRPPTTQKGIYWPVGLQSPCTSRLQVEVDPGSQATPQELASLSGDPPEGWQRGTHSIGLRPTHQPSKSSQGSLSLVDPCPLPTQTPWPGHMVLSRRSGSCAQPWDLGVRSAPPRSHGLDIPFLPSLPFSGAPPSYLGR